MADALLSAFLQVLFEKLASKDVLDFFETKRLDKSLLNKLEIALISANKLLYDAEQKWFIDPLVKKWMDELKDAVCDAEDLLDEIATKMLEKEAKAQSGTTTCKVCNMLTPPFMTGSIGFDLNNVFERLAYIVDQKDKLGLKEVTERERETVYKVRSTTSLMEKSRVFGRENDKQALLELLLCDAQTDEGNPIVIAVLGMGGIGKTTLARLAYNDDKVEEHFQLKGWVCVSDPFDLCKLTKITLEEFGSPMSETDNINQLQLHLKMVLTGKKFLLILDDVWNEDYNKWNDFLTPLTYGAPGSKIVVTTRNERVAQVMEANKLHRLDKLQDEDSWGLFSQHAFNGHNCEEGSKFEQVARYIVVKCSGLPLALKTMGRLLHSEGELSKWEAISKSNLWESQLGKTILPPLLLSYHYLSPQLKRCFSYCSIFPKDCVYDKQQLILLWIAEDIITKDSNDIRSIEEIGEECFDDLISRSLLNFVDDRKSCFSMHHLVNDLARFISGQTFCSFDGGRLHEVSIKTRHLSYLRQWYDVYSKFKELSVAKNLRTFVPLALEIDSIPSLNQLSYETIRHLVPTLKRMRVLSLIGYEKVAHLPIKMETLKHLRYLDLSYNNELQELPDSICTLHNLQTLLLVDCYSLAQLPANIVRLAKLRHLDLRGTCNLRRMPVGMSKLKDLQTLTDYDLTEGNGSQIKEVGALENLTGSLAIRGIGRVVSSKDAKEAFLKRKKFLKKLVLEWGFSGHGLQQEEEEILEMLHPHENLKELTIKDYNGKMFPGWLTNSIPNISVVELIGCQQCEVLPPLGQLPSLKSLRIRKLHEVVRVGSEFEGNNPKPFRSLESLEFDGMKNWKEWIIFEGQNEESSSAFPCLQDLIIRNCPELTKALPSLLHSLSRLIIEDCPKLEASIPITPNLEELKLENCDNLSMGSEIKRLKSMQVRRLSTFSIQSVPPSVTNLRVTDCDEMGFVSSEHAILQYVDLNDGYGSLASLPLDKFPSLKSLTVEFADNLENLSSLDGSSSQHPVSLLQLNSLFLMCCNKLACFPRGGLNAPSLTLLRLWWCSNLKLLPDDMHKLLPSLRSLEIEFCPQLETFPVGGLPPSLVELQISSSKKLVRCDMSLELQKSLSCLKTLVIDDGLDEEDPLGAPFPQEGLLPTSLTSLSIDIQNMVSLSTVRLQRLTSLQELTIKDCSDLQYLFSKKDKEEDMQLPPSLTSLSITGCINLESLENIDLHRLTSLQELTIYECPKLQAMPKEQLPASLLELCIDECPKLSKRCQRVKGKDWKRISHISYIVIDGVVASC